MEKLNLEYLEDVLATSALHGPDKEIVCPAIMDFVSDKTILNQENRFVLESAKNHFHAHQTFPSFDELQAYITNDSSQKLFVNFLKKCKKFKKIEFERKTLLKQSEELFRQRLLSHTITEGYADSIETGELNIEEIYANIEQAMSISLQDDLGLSIFRDADDYVNELENEESRISTGWEWLDNQLGGGLLSSGSALYTFCAASNIGKSNCIKSLACNLSKQGKNSLIVSLEMPRYIYANRFVSELTNIGISSLKNESQKIKGFLVKAQQEKGYGDIVIKDYATGSITPQMLNSYIKRLEKQTGIVFDAIFVDYPALFKKSTQFSGRYDLAVAESYIQTRALSFYHQKPIICVAQLNRKSYDAKSETIPSMENIGDSIGIAACSDFMGFLYASDEMKELNHLGMSVGKSRFGPVNQKKLFDINPLTLKLSETGSPTEINVDLDDEDEDNELLKSFM